MNHSQYISLFREVARKHVDIAHTDDSPHFARIVLTRDPFLDSRAQISEFLESAAFRLKSPVLLVSSYTADYGDMQDDFLRKGLTGRMVVLQDTRKGNFNDEEAAYTDTERMGEECLMYLNEHFENNPQEGMLLWNNAGNEKLSGITDRNFCGTGFTFTILSNDNPYLSYNPEKFSI